MLRERVSGARGRLSARQALPLLLGQACLSAIEISPTLIAIRDGCAQRPRPPAPSTIAVQPAAVPDAAGIEEVIVRERYVTGSRIRLPDAQSPGHMDIIDRSDIALAGNQDLGALLRALPAVAGNSTSTLVTNGGDGSANITLRGLPASNTLVLLNGRRANTDPWGGRSVDLNTIPLGLVDRIEVLKEGASALYGSDAIAGVVNIVTQRNLAGLEVSTYYGGASRDDLRTVNSDLTYGGEFGALTFTLGAAYYDQDPLYSRDRSLSASSDNRRLGGVDQRSSATVPARASVDGTVLTLANDRLDGSDPSHFRPATSDDLFEYRRYTTAIVPSRRYSLFADARHPGADGEFYAEFLFTDTHARNTLAPTPLFTAFELIDLTVAADAVFNPFDEPLLDVRRRVTELGARQQTNDTDTSRIVLGWEGDLGAVHWDTRYGYNVTDATERRSRLLRASRVAQSLGPASACTGACVGLDLFGPAGSVDQGMIDYLGVNAMSHGRSEMHHLAVNADASTLQLPAGAIEVASGVEYRRESLGVRPDRLIAEADTIGGTSDSRFDGGRDLWEAYVEAWIPLAAQRRAIHKLDAQVALRASHYSDFGATTNPRLAVHYWPSQSVLLRASATQGFRAPTLRQLHAGASQTFERLNDPCAQPGNVGVLPGCAIQSDPTLVQFMTIRTGDNDLDAERAQTFTAGVVITPTAIPGLTASLDYYRISGKDVVDANAQYIVNENARALAFPEQVIRGGDGNILRVLAPFQNIGRREVRGLDLELSHEFTVRGTGALELALKASRIESFEEQIEPGGSTIDYAGTFRDEASAGNGALPDWKVNLSVIWKHQLWNVGYHTRYVSTLDEIVPGTETRRTIDAWRVDRLQASYLGPLSLWTKVTLGIDNLWDEPPPFSAAAFNDSYDSRTYDITGRYAYLLLQRQF